MQYTGSLAVVGRGCCVRVHARLVRPDEDHRPDPAARAPLPENVEFQLHAEFDGPCEARTAIDVNLGHAPEAFVRAAHCQINGAEPDAPTGQRAGRQQLRTVSWVRRIDVVRSLCTAAGRRAARLSYSDPWQAQVLADDALRAQDARATSARC